MNQSIFPFINTEMVEELAEQPSNEILCEYAYDFEQNCLAKDAAGRNYYVYGNDALQIHIYKALMTESFRHLAYSQDYGNEMLSLIGQSMNEEIAKMEVKRYIVEALMYDNDYITELKDFEFEVKESKMSVRFTVLSVYGEMDIDTELKGVSG